MQRRQVDLAEIADGAEVGPIGADDGAEGQVAFTGGGDLAAGADAHGIGIDQQGDHHGHVEGRLAAQFLGVILVEGSEVELGDEIDVIFDRFDGDVVQVIRILHGKRDLRRIMQEETSE